MTDTEAESENMDEREWQEIRDLPDAFSRKEPLSTEKEEETQEDLRERFTHLTDEEVVEMSHQGEPLAEDYLLDKYKNFVRAKARSYFLIGADHEDIVQEGMIGLYKAIRDYRTDKQTSFRGFAEDQLEDEYEEEGDDRPAEPVDSRAGVKDIEDDGDREGPVFGYRFHGLLDLKKEVMSAAHSSARIPEVTSVRGWSREGEKREWPRFGSGAP